MAKHFDIAPASVAQWEIGRSRPEIDKLPKLATLYGVTLEVLCGEDIPMPRPVFDGAGLEPGDEASKAVEQQLLFLKRAWVLLSGEERTALLTTAEALAAPRRKSA